MELISTITAASWIAFILYWIISSFGIKRDMKRTAWWQNVWVRMTAMGILVAWVIGSIAKSANHQPIFGREPMLPTAGLGVVLTILGIAFAIWARAHLGRNWSPAPAIKENHELITSGPYATVRHPIYTGMLIAALGSGLVYATWFIMFVIALFVFLRRVRIEESFMMSQFPNQYPEYKKRTWALIPFIF